MSNKLIAKYMRSIDEMQVKVLQKQQDLKTVRAQISPIDNWSTRVKNGTLKNHLIKIQNDIDELQASISCVNQKLKDTEQKERNFESFLQPIIKAGFLVYKDGKYAYTAQQLKILRGINEIDHGCCLVNPKIFDKADDYFSSLGYRLDSPDLPGDSDLLPEDYQKYIKSIFSLYNCFYGITRKLDVVSKCSSFDFSIF